MQYIDQYKLGSDTLQTPINDLFMNKIDLKSKMFLHDCCIHIDGYSINLIHKIVTTAIDVIVDIIR